MRKATFDLERQFGALTGKRIAGIDEAGRGPWAGPVVAAAVILDPANIPDGLADSKALSEPALERALTAIEAAAIAIGVGIADVHRIDRDNILRATDWAMAEAVARLDTPIPDLALIDGNRTPNVGCRAEAVVKGDARCLSIAAASIVAKVTRDRLMRALADECPGYGFEQHKGYGTKAHKAALDTLGPTAHHRRSFRPVQLALGLA
jgi:ribonuclease HII